MMSRYGPQRGRMSAKNDLLFLSNFGFGARFRPIGPNHLSTINRAGTTSTRTT